MSNAAPPPAKRGRSGAPGVACASSEATRRHGECGEDTNSEDEMAGADDADHDSTVALIPSYEGINTHGTGKIQMITNYIVTLQLHAKQSRMREYALRHSASVQQATTIASNRRLGRL